MIGYLESQGQYAGLIDGVNVSLTDKYKVYVKAYLEVDVLYRIGVIFFIVEVILVKNLVSCVYYNLSSECTTVWSYRGLTSICHYTVGSHYPFCLSPTLFLLVTTKFFSVFMCLFGCVYLVFKNISHKNEIISCLSFSDSFHLK